MTEKMPIQPLTAFINESMDFNKLFNSTLSDFATTAEGICHEKCKEKQIEDIIIVPIVFSCITLTGLVGNGLVVYVLMRFGDRKVTDFFIVNLASADLCLLLLAAPFTMIHYVIESWYFGLFLCKFNTFVINMSIFATSMTLSVMAIDRYQIIVHPMLSMGYRTQRMAIIISLTIWLLSFLLATPYTRYIHLEDHLTTDGVILCRMKWPNLSIGRAAAAFIVVSAYIIPFSIMCFCYSKIIIHLWRQAALIAAHVSQGQKAGISLKKIQLRKRRRATMMVAIVALLFIICWLPAHIINLWMSFDNNFPYTSNILYNFKIFAHTLSYLNSVVNPFVYCFLGDGFRKAIRKAFPRYYRKKQQKELQKAARQNGDKQARNNINDNKSNIDKKVANPCGDERGFTEKSRNYPAKRIKEVYPLSNIIRSFAKCDKSAQRNTDKKSKSMPLLSSQKNEISDNNQISNFYSENNKNRYLYSSNENQAMNSQIEIQQEEIFQNNINSNSSETIKTNEMRFAEYQFESQL